ncbi:MAG: glycine cleavage system protein GcvH [Calditrichaeota bacterium]|nr:MAG: glycine cleavage system protein GcvH [Calditrichota bacterium]
MNVPENLLYTREHEWARLEGDVATVGITDYAQDKLGDIVFVELPEVGTEVHQVVEADENSEGFGTIEAVKAVADLYAPFSGEVIEVNEALDGAPEKVNEDPYGEGWMIKIKISNPAEKENLLTPEAYRELIENEAE